MFKKSDFYNYHSIALFDREIQMLHSIRTMLIAEQFWIDMINEQSAPYFTLARQLAYCWAIKVIEKEPLENVLNPQEFFPIFPWEIKNHTNYKIESTKSIKYTLHKKERCLITTFISDCAKNKNPYNLLSEPYPTYTSYKLPLENMVPFSLHVLFYYKKHKLRKKKDGDKTAFKTILENSSELLKKPDRDHKIESDIFLSYKIDKVLKLFKVARMCYWKDTMMPLTYTIQKDTEGTKAESTGDKPFADVSIVIADTLCNCLNLNYLDTINLGRNFDRFIFSDRKFIDFCLNTDYPDPFFILQFVIRETAKEYKEHQGNHFLQCVWESIEGGKDTDKYRLFHEQFSLEEFFSFCKKRTQEIIKLQLKLISIARKDIAKKHKLHSEFNLGEIKKLYEKIEESSVEANKFLGLYANTVYTEYDNNYIHFENDEGGETILVNQDTIVQEMTSHLDKTDNDMTSKELDEDFAEDTSFIQNAFWNEYYSQEGLQQYVEAPDSEKYKYMNFLFSFVIENLSHFS